MKQCSSFLVVLLLMLASFTSGVEYQHGDVDHDGLTGNSEVTCLIDYLLTDSWHENPVTPLDTHEYVDLGLPNVSGWCTDDCKRSSRTPFAAYDP